MYNVSKFNSQVSIVSNLPQNYKPNLKYFTSFLGDCINQKFDVTNTNTFHYYCYNSEINNDWKNRVFTSVFNYLSI